MNNYYVNNCIKVEIPASDLFILSNSIRNTFDLIGNYGLNRTTPPLLMIEDSKFYFIYGILENTENELASFKYPYNSEKKYNLENYDIKTIIDKMFAYDNALIEQDSSTIIVRELNE